MYKVYKVYINISDPQAGGGGGHVFSQRHNLYEYSTDPSVKYLSSVHGMGHQW
jgi:hypothetical protein